jgi:hypothetical protein
MRLVAPAAVAQATDLRTNTAGRAYNRAMARGWESKSVEEQQSEFSKVANDQKAAATPESRARASAIQTLRLKRARVLQQLRDSQNPRYAELMQKELAYLDAQLSGLGNTDKE